MLCLKRTYGTIQLGTTAILSSSEKSRTSPHLQRCTRTKSSMPSRQSSRRRKTKARGTTFVGTEIDPIPFSRIPLTDCRVLRKADLPLSEIHDFCAEFANLSEPDAVRSSLALDVLADIYTKDKDRGADAALVRQVTLMRIFVQRIDLLRLGFGSPGAQIRSYPCQLLELQEKTAGAGERGCLKICSLALSML